MRSLLRPPSPAMVVALIALFVALGGSAFAVTKINGTTLVNRSVSNLKIKKDSLTKNEIDEARLARVPRANQANESNFARNAGRLDGQVADRFQFRCETGAIRGYTLVAARPDFPADFDSSNANVPDAYNCAAGGDPAVRRLEAGRYRVRFPGNASRIGVANAYGAGSSNRFASVNREAGTNEWEVVIHDAVGQPVDQPFVLVLA